MSLRSDCLMARKFDKANSKFPKSPRWKYFVKQTIKDITKWFRRTT